jgi:hypothetical protein
MGSASKNSQLSPGVSYRETTVVTPEANEVAMNVLSWTFSGFLVQADVGGTPAGSLAAKYQASPDADLIDYGAILPLAAASQAVALTLGTHPELCLAYSVQLYFTDAIADGDTLVAVTSKS